MNSAHDKSLTLFSWGYEGWGNAVPDLLKATERVERACGFKAPVFVDVRFRRAVRAARAGNAEAIDMLERIDAPKR